MPLYTHKELRRAILVTLAYVEFTPFTPRAILNALRPSGYPDLSEAGLLGHINYLERKGYVKVERGMNFVTGEEVEQVSIEPQGVDIVKGDCVDVGIACV